MQSMYCVGLDLHKKTISYCVKDASGRIRSEGTIPATRVDLDRWMKTLPQPWTAATPNCRRSCARSAAPRATKPAADARPFASVTSILPRGSNMLLRGSHAPRSRDFGMWDQDRKPHSENACRFNWSYPGKAVTRRCAESARTTPKEDAASYAIAIDRYFEYEMPLC